MADQKISVTPAAGPIVGTEILLGDQGGLTVVMTPNQLATFIAANRIENNGVTDNAAGDQSTAINAAFSALAIAAVNGGITLRGVELFAPAVGQVNGWNTVLQPPDGWTPSTTFTDWMMQFAQGNSFVWQLGYWGALSGLVLSNTGGSAPNLNPTQTNNANFPYPIQYAVGLRTDAAVLASTSPPTYPVTTTVLTLPRSNDGSVSLNSNCPVVGGAAGYGSANAPTTVSIGGHNIGVGAIGGTTLSSLTCADGPVTIPVGTPVIFLEGNGRTHNLLDAMTLSKWSIGLWSHAEQYSTIRNKTYSYNRIGLLMTPSENTNVIADVDMRFENAMFNANTLHALMYANESTASSFVGNRISGQRMNFSYLCDLALIGQQWRYSGAGGVPDPNNTVTPGTPSFEWVAFENGQYDASWTKPGEVGLSAQNRLGQDFHIPCYEVSPNANLPVRSGALGKMYNPRVPMCSLFVEGSQHKVQITGASAAAWFLVKIGTAGQLDLPDPAGPGTSDGFRFVTYAEHEQYDYDTGEVRIWGNSSQLGMAKNLARWPDRWMLWANIQDSNRFTSMSGWGTSKIESDLTSFTIASSSTASFGVKVTPSSLGSGHQDNVLQSSTRSPMLPNITGNGITLTSNDSFLETTGRFVGENVRRIVTPNWYTTQMTLTGPLGFDYIADSGGISGGSASVTVQNNGARFQNGSYIQIDSEYMLITGISGNVLSVSRGQTLNGQTSSAVSHSAGACVWQVTCTVNTTSAANTDVWMINGLCDPWGRKMKEKVQVISGGGTTTLQLMRGTLPAVGSVQPAASHGADIFRSDYTFPCYAANGATFTKCQAGASGNGFAASAGNWSLSTNWMWGYSGPANPTKFFGNSPTVEYGQNYFGLWAMIPSTANQSTGTGRNSPTYLNFGWYMSETGGFYPGERTFGGGSGHRQVMVPDRWTLFSVAKAAGGQAPSTPGGDFFLSLWCDADEPAIEIRITGLFGISASAANREMLNRYIRDGVIVRSLQ